MDKLQKIIMIVAGGNLLLAIYILVSIMSYQPEDVELITNSPGYEEPNTPSENGEYVGEPVVDEVIEVPKKAERPTLTTHELEQIPESRNPFGTSPIVTETFEKREEAYQKEKEVEQKKVERQIAEQKLTDHLSRKPTTKEMDNYIETNILPPVAETPSLDSEGNPTSPDANNETTTGNTPNSPDSATGEDPLKKTVPKAEVSKIAEEKAKKYGIPKEWIVEVVNKTSKYQADLVTTKDKVERRGLMQFRQDKAKFIAESIGVYYRPSLDFNATMNIEMGAYYLSYLKGIEDDKHFVMTAYYFGETEAKRLKTTRGNYETDFSKSIFGKGK